MLFWSCILCLLLTFEIKLTPPTPAPPVPALSAMETIILLTFFGLIIRLTWVVTVINGRTASVVLVDQYTESILLKVPQILWMSAFLYIALV